MPTALKILSGNRGRRPLNHREPKPEIVLPPPPDHLDSIGRQEWDRVAPVLYELGVLSRLDVGVLAAMCAAHSLDVTLTNLVCKHGAVLYGPKQRPYPNPMLKLAAAARRDKVRFAIELGMTPSARTRISVVRLDDDGEDEFLD
jgi:P27 family predicted phage terminase small subunit